MNHRILCCLFFGLLIPFCASAQSIDINRQLRDAVSAADLPEVKRCLAQGADPGATAKGEQTALEIAAEQFDPEFMRILLTRAVSHAAANDALLAAAGAGAVGIKTLDTGTVPVRSTSSIEAQTQEPSSQIIKMLLRAGADVNFQEPTSGQTPLMIAAGVGQAQNVRVLLEHGADPNATDKDGATALLFAACDCGLATMPDVMPGIKLLLEHGAELHVRDSEGSTALMRAASAGRSDIVQLFLDLGADPSEKNKDGKTALTMAQERDENGDHAQVIEILQGAKR